MSQLTGSFGEAFATSTCTVTTTTASTAPTTDLSGAGRRTFAELVTVRPVRISSTGESPEVPDGTPVVPSLVAAVDETLANINKDDSNYCIAAAIKLLSANSSRLETKIDNIGDDNAEFRASAQE